MLLFELFRPRNGALSLLPRHVRNLNYARPNWGTVSVRPAVRPREGDSPTIKPYREYVPFPLPLVWWECSVKLSLVHREREEPIFEHIFARQQQTGVPQRCSIDVKTMIFQNGGNFCLPIRPGDTAHCPPPHRTEAITQRNGHERYRCCSCILHCSNRKLASFGIILSNPCEAALCFLNRLFLSSSKKKRKKFDLTTAVTAHVRTSAWPGELTVSLLPLYVQCAIRSCTRLIFDSLRHYNRSTDIHCLFLGLLHAVGRCAGVRRRAR